MILLGTAAAIIIAAGLRSVAWLIGPAFLALIIVIALAKALLVDIDPRAAWADALLRASASDTDGSTTTPAAPHRLRIPWPHHQRTPG